jgi:hypothetical protein
MTTYNDQANSRYVAAYRADVASGFGDNRHATGLLSALRGYANRSFFRSKAWLRSGNGLEADTRQIRNYGRSTTQGACEVRLGLRLAT